MHCVCVRSEEGVGCDQTRAPFQTHDIMSKPYNYLVNLGHDTMCFVV